MIASAKPVLVSLVMIAAYVALAKVAMQQNVDMRKISAWVAIAAVPTMVAGIYGMNFEYMPELDDRWGYPVALALMIASAAGSYWFARRLKWL